ncbi:MAG: GNAT family N-acetyltransferase [Paracoccaceae bacterium]
MTQTTITIPTLHTDRLTLRALNASDFGPLCAFYASDRARFVGGPATAEQTWRILAGEIGHWTLRGYGRFCVVDTETDQMVGLVGPWNPYGWPEAEIGWDLMNGFEGRGYATEAAKAARDFAFNTLGWTTAISLVAIGNDASARVAQRLGCIEDAERFIHERFGETRVFRHPMPQPAEGRPT